MLQIGKNRGSLYSLAEGKNKDRKKVTAKRGF